MTHTPVQIHGHSEAIQHLRTRGLEVLQEVRDREAAGDSEDKDSAIAVAFAATCMLAAADLLEVHDATGINLTTFDSVETFVNAVLLMNGFDPVQDNHA